MGLQDFCGLKQCSFGHEIIVILVLYPVVFNFFGHLSGEINTVSIG